MELDDILKPEEGFVQVNNEQTNDNHTSGMIQNQTNNYNGSEKITESLLDQITFLKEENQRLRKEIEQLKNM
ncbi:MAG TPA: hypothetical protein VF455_02815 [Chryseobacterium sp.]